MANERARALRRQLTDAERKLWSILRQRQLGELKFRRQVPIGPYIVDFVCLRHRLIVEADGGQHCESKRDERRDAYLQAQGFRILRFWNNDIFENEACVCDAILAALESPLPNPSPAEGRGALGRTRIGGRRAWWLRVRRSCFGRRLARS